eukprot:Clim_evm1s231 gene=Clim_evmTU1s231
MKQGWSEILPEPEPTDDKASDGPIIGQPSTSAAARRPRSKSKGSLFSLGRSTHPRIFDITKEDLGDIVDFDDREDPEQVRRLEDEGGVEVLMQRLESHPHKGIAKNDDFDGRRAWFGKNVIPPPPSKTIFGLVLEAFQDRILQLLLGGAIIILIAGTITHPSNGWIEGVAIFIAVFIVVAVTAGNDYQKDQKFRAMLLLQSDKSAKVFRGGEEDQISSWDLCVGDVVSLAMGDEILADGIMITGTHLTIDESPLTGETVPVKKSRQKPFLFSGCQVSNGWGTMVITGVGPHSSGGKIQEMLNAEQGQDTPLQEKLAVFAILIGYIGLVAGALTFGGLTIRWIVEISEKTWDWSFLLDLLDYFILAVSIVVVAVPEGLPLAVTISLAYSMVKMIKDQNFVRHLSASETMGEATCICSDKTGTLTENRMTVVECVLGTERLDPKNISDHGATGEVFKILADGICVNSTAFIKQEPGETLPTFVGSATEGALLYWAKRMGVNYVEVREKVPVIEEAVFAFTSDRKRMSTTVSKPDGSYRVYLKGASEIVLGLCTRIQKRDGEIMPMNADFKKMATDTVNELAGEGLRTLVLAYRDVTMCPQEAAEVENDLIFVCLVGIKDPVRAEVPEAVAACHRAGLTVRMVTGDNILTAKKIAQECGIYNDKGIAMEGPVWRALSDDEKEDKVDQLQVLARSSPADKYELVKRLKARGEVVAVTGDGTNDAPALKEADVGFAMGQSGTQIAKNASDIVLLDDNFSSIVKAIRWGRNVFDCIRKFLQFQLSVNLVAIIVTFVGAVVTGESPLGPVQLLWVNLIMDTLGALALATDEPSKDVMQREPHTRDEHLLTRTMLHYVCFHLIWQSTVLLIMLFVGYRALGVDDDDTMTINTIVFNLFVMLQINNEILARHLDHEPNPFKGLFSNWLFLSIIIIIFVIQIIIVQYCGDFTNTIQLNLEEWLACLIIGGVTLPLCSIFRVIMGAVEKCQREPKEPGIAGLHHYRSLNLSQLSLHQLKANQSGPVQKAAFNTLLQRTRSRALLHNPRSQPGVTKPSTSQLNRVKSF